jgi:transcriptional regulator with XRE-family HTH domain
MSPGKLLKQARRRHGVSQSGLATRAGTTQSAISRIERDRVSPSMETLGELLYLLGEDLVIESKGRDAGIDRTLNEAQLKLSPSDRLDYGLAFASQVIEMSPNPKRPGWNDR